jgi:organic hydroperoxide reductase OsmC/OhrA
MKKIFAAAIALCFISAPAAFASQSQISSGLVHQVKVIKKAKAKKPGPKRHVKKPVRKPIRKPIRH